MYSQLLLFVMTVVVLPGSLGQSEVPGTLVNRPLFSAYSINRDMCDGVNVYTTCNDCRSVRACIGAIEDVRDCKEMSPEKPFCINGACSDQHPNSAECPLPSMTCTGAGYFPDPTNCEVYHECDYTGAPSTLYQCPPNYVYNADTNMCRKKKFASDCVSVKCDLKKLFVSYGASDSFYAYCMYNKTDVKNIIMLKCPEYFKFDGTSCVFVCPREGNFAHANPNKYYQCYYSDSELIYLERICPVDKVFDQVAKTCVRLATTTLRVATTSATSPRTTTTTTPRPTTTTSTTTTTTTTARPTMSTTTPRTTIGVDPPIFI